MKSKFKFRTKTRGDVYTADVNGDNVCVSKDAWRTTFTRSRAQDLISDGLWEVIDEDEGDESPRELESFDFYCPEDREQIYTAQELEDGSFNVSWTDSFGRRLSTLYSAMSIKQAVGNGSWIKVCESGDQEQSQVNAAISQLETLRLQSKNTKCWFTIADGKFLVQNGSVDYWCDNEKDLFEIISMVEKLDEFADK